MKTEDEYPMVFNNSNYHWWIEQGKMQKGEGEALGELEALAMVS